MNKLFSVFIFLLVSTILFSCKKEQDLSPNEEAAATQQAGINFLNNGGQVDVGGSGGNSSSNVDQFMRATVDGSNKTYSTFNYQENAPLLSISGLDNSTSITFSLTSIPNSGDIIDLGDQLSGGATYVPGVGVAYSSIDGQLIIDSTTTTFIRGRFNFNAENNNGSDTVSITSGSFKIAR